MKPTKNNMTSDISNTNPKSNWKPQKNYHAINTFIEAVDNARFQKLGRP